MHVHFSLQIDMAMDLAKDRQNGTQRKADLVHFDDAIT